MAKGGKLKAAIDDHRGVDYSKLKQKKLQKQAAQKRKHTVTPDQALQNEIVEYWAGIEDEDSDEGGVPIDLNEVNGIEQKETVCTF